MTPEEKLIILYNSKIKLHHFHEIILEGLYSKISRGFKLKSQDIHFINEVYPIYFGGSIESV